MLIDRIAGDSPKSEGSEALQMELPASGKLTVDQLEKYLWSAADILRGSIDSSDYKNFIFGILFLKRLSDVFEEEAEKLIAKGASKDVAWNDPDEHQFFVPKRARWKTIQKTATNIGEALNKACMALEEQNPSLEGYSRASITTTSTSLEMRRTGTLCSRGLYSTSRSSR